MGEPDELDELIERSEPVERVDEQDEVIGVVDRGEAIRHGWLHRVATIVCRDSSGRTLVHRRPDDASRFPGHFNWLLGGATEVAESYEDAAARELAEELGVRGRPRFLFGGRADRSDASSGVRTGCA
ncbi:NUDIX domain-containing protein [Streptomyces ipomoeae]|uniref:NUDIX domain-containing protein n=1 Tax=Streptomyces ipomoeae TaxID=103232 RepID=UPI0011468C78|nr:NUDIX domain-containing protein [Streptomyces ipomoeae]MDX2937370.1 NUDIX domain-containing protein [Streptomyces ipomoeae]TQE23828.1 NUDIX domain-containing protein [Streptomyces ipomoeae]